MIRSMTGFARRERQFPWGLLAWELKTVNHRFLEMGCRLPEEFRVAEADFRQTIAAAVRRGKVECSLHFRPAAASDALEVDAVCSPRSPSGPEQIARQAGAAARIDVTRPVALARGHARPTQDARAADRRRARAARGCAGGLARSRDSEGGRLRDALEQRCAGTRSNFAARVADRLPDVRARMRAKLLERIAQLCTDVDQDRLEQELAMLAQRLDVDEEIHRLRGHVAEVSKAFASQEPAGRRLDFLMQELNREANTLSSKSQDIETTRAAVDMKVLIEQMREQVQNIE